MRLSSLVAMLAIGCGGSGQSSEAESFGLACQYGAKPDPACGAAPNACMNVGNEFSMCSRWCGDGCPDGAECSESDPRLGICVVKCSRDAQCPAGSLCGAEYGGSCRPR